MGEFLRSALDYIGGGQEWCHSERWHGFGGKCGGDWGKTFSCEAITGRRFVCALEWVSSRLIDWLIVSLSGHFVRSIDRLIDWLIDWLIAFILVFSDALDLFNKNFLCEFFRWIRLRLSRAGSGDRKRLRTEGKFVLEQEHRCMQIAVLFYEILLPSYVFSSISFPAIYGLNIHWPSFFRRDF